MRNRIFAVLAIAILAGGGLAYGTYNFCSNQPVKTVAHADAAGRGRRRRSADRRRDEERRRDGRRTSRPGRRPQGVVLEAVRRHRPRPDRADRDERADPRRQAGVEGSGRRAAAGDSRRACAPSRCASTKSSASPATCCPGTRVDVVATASPTQTVAGHDLEGRSRQRPGADRRHAHGAGRGRSGKPHAGDRRHAARHPGAGRARWRSPAPKARFSSRCATRSTRVRRRRLASSTAVLARHGAARPRQSRRRAAEGRQPVSKTAPGRAADRRDHPRRQARPK